VTSRRRRGLLQVEPRKGTPHRETFDKTGPNLYPRCHPTNSFLELSILVFVFSLYVYLTLPPFLYFLSKSLAPQCTG
jgi:hypothetical protein